MKYANELVSLKLEVGLLKAKLAKTQTLLTAAYSERDFDLGIAHDRGFNEALETAACVVEDSDDGVPLQCLADSGIRTLIRPLGGPKLYNWRITDE